MTPGPSRCSSDARDRRGIALLGLAGALLYGLAFTLPYWLPDHCRNVQVELFSFAAREPWRGILYYASLAILFVLYLCALRLAARSTASVLSLRGVLLWTLLFCLLLLPVQPLTSSDVYGYVFQGRIVSVLGQNPFAHLYRDFSSDPFYFCVTFHNLPATTGYGPLWVAVEALLGLLAPGRLLLNLLLFKGLAAGLHLAGVALAYAALGGRSPGQRLAGTLLYAWNPLLLLELVANAHNDAAVACLALLAFWLLPGRRWWLGMAALALAALVKPVALLWLPLAGVAVVARTASWPRRILHGSLSVLLPLLLAVAASAPFWVGPATFRGLLAQSDISGNSLPHLLIQGLWMLWPDARVEIVRAVKLLTALGFLPFYASRIWASRRDLFAAAYDVMLFYFVVAGLQFMPWYVAWLLAPAALLDGARRADRWALALALSAAAPLLYFPFGWQWAQRTLPVAAVAALSALPALALAAWFVLRWARSRREAR